jgi:hypothetical protein
VEFGAGFDVVLMVSDGAKTGAEVVEQSGGLGVFDTGGWPAPGVVLVVVGVTVGPGVDVVVSMRGVGDDVVVSMRGAGDDEVAVTTGCGMSGTTAGPGSAAAGGLSAIADVDTSFAAPPKATPGSMPRRTAWTPLPAGPGACTVNWPVPTAT